MRPYDVAAGSLRRRYSERTKRDELRIYGTRLAEAPLESSPCSPQLSHLEHNLRAYRDSFSPRQCGLSIKAIHREQDGAPGYFSSVFSSFLCKLASSPVTKMTLLSETQFYDQTGSRLRISGSLSSRIGNHTPSLNTPYQN